MYTRCVSRASRGVTPRMVYSTNGYVEPSDATTTAPICMQILHAYEACALPDSDIMPAHRRSLESPHYLFPYRASPIGDLDVDVAWSLRFGGPRPRPAERVCITPTLRGACGESTMGCSRAMRSVDGVPLLPFMESGLRATSRFRQRLCQEKDVRHARCVTCPVAPARTRDCLSVP